MAACPGKADEFVVPANAVAVVALVTIMSKCSSPVEVKRVMSDLLMIVSWGSGVGGVVLVLIGRRMACSVSGRCPVIW